jgi:outer membrane protein OmpA-like peptidoglycan-associated protein
MKSPKFVLLTLGALSMTLVGCKSVSQRDYDAAIDENTQLRERIAGLQESVRQANESNSAFQSQNEQLRNDNARLQGELNSANAQPRTGFEGINGVDLSTRNGAIVVGVASEVLFASGSADLRSNAKSTLDEVVGVIRSQYANNEIRVEGYTDTDKLVKTKDKWVTNERLSAHRALAVEEYLVSKGINNDRIYSAAFGPSKPKGTKQASRRVEIVILGQ